MARGGMLTALQAALAGVSGGAAGYARQQQQAKEEAARMRDEERQRLRDALSQSQYDLQKQEFQARYGPEAIARQQAKDAADREARLKEAGIAAAASGAATRAQLAAEERDNEAQGLAYLSELRADPNAAKALGAIFAARPDLARRPGLAAYQILKRRSDAEMQRVRRAQAGLPDETPASGASGTPAAGGRVYSPMAGGSYGSTSAKPQITRREYDALKSQGYSDAQLSARYEVME